MAEGSVLNAIPGYTEALKSAAKPLGETFLAHAPVNLEPLVMFIIALSVMFALVLAARPKLANTSEAVIPDDRLTLRTFFELFFDTVMALMIEVMGEKNARRFFPLIGTIAVVVFFSNFLGLMPGMLPPTDKFSVNLAIAGVVFIATHVAGFQTNGIGHLAHMANPVGVWWGWFLAPLMLPIELIGHLVRPVSLSLRLMGNMIGDHAVLGVFLGLIPLVVPIPFLILGSIVCTVQTLVFTLLSIVYIGLALEEQHHDEEGHH